VQAIVAARAMELLGVVVAGAVAVASVDALDDAVYYFLVRIELPTGFEVGLYIFKIYHNNVSFVCYNLSQKSCPFDEKAAFEREICPKDCVCQKIIVILHIMATARIIHSIPDGEWQELLSVSPTASWWQSPACYEALRHCPTDLTVFAVGVERQNDDGSTRLVALCMGYIPRDKWLLREYFSRRAIIQAGPLLAPDCSEDEAELLMSTIRRLGKARDVIYVETRNFADYSPWREAFCRAGFSYAAHYDVHIAIDGWRKRMSESTCRNIKKLLDAGHSWQATQDATDICDWYALLSRLYRRKVHRPLLSLDLMRTMIESGAAVLLVTRSAEGKTDGGVLLTIAGGVAYEWYICGDALATYAALCYAEQSQLRLLDTMGAGEPDKPYGVRDFKLRMGGTLLEYGRYRAVLKTTLWRIGTAVMR